MLALHADRNLSKIDKDCQVLTLGEKVTPYVHGYLTIMATMNISLPDSLRDHVADRVVEEDFSTPSDYVRTLIREDRQRRALFRQRRTGLEALQRVVSQGIEDADAGRMHALDDVVFDVKRHGRKRLATAATLGICSCA